MIILVGLLASAALLYGGIVALNAAIVATAMAMAVVTLTTMIFGKNIRK